MAEDHDPETPPLVVDDNADNESVDDGDSALGVDGASDTASLRSSILRYREENGRTYHAYKDGDIQHHLFTLTFDGKLHTAPLTQPLHRVLDAGTGTGIWAIDFGKSIVVAKDECTDEGIADEHPECGVRRGPNWFVEVPN
ncbi:hypothetical protein QQZ08_001505 [Neonectria magnoliae]|uniref:Methyltransferase domain-containing protein n=1 Tax=Neonectria magnoliae TaxID=2732573 RepID=A0ABR1IFE3_9HYPO